MKITHEIQISDSNDAFLNSRGALANILTAQGHKIDNLKNDLELINYQNLILFPQYLTSISHTRGAGAAVLADKNDYLSLGIDIEWSTRQLKPESQKFFRNQDDKSTEDLLKLWTMKEAAFKALSPLGYPGVLVLSKIIIQNDEFWTSEKKEVVGKIETFKLPTNNRELYISVAHVPK